VLAGPEPAAAFEWPTERARGTVYGALALATLALCLLNGVNVHGLGGTPPTSQLPASLGLRVLGVAVVAPLPLAIRYPMLAWRIGWLELLLAPIVPAAWWGGWPWGPAQVIALLVAFCLAGIRNQRPELWLMWALTLIPWWLWLSKDVPNLGGPAGATVVFAATGIAVDSIGSWLRARHALAVQTERIEVERARRAVLEERSRIARELHDVVAHHMSLIAVRAETAPYRLTDLTDSARAEFGSLSVVAREALADMRRLLGVLRQDEVRALAPQPKLADLPELIDATCRAGIQVEMNLPSALDDIPAAVGMCAYRIVQESLSNAAQHSPGAAVTVSVSYDNGGIVVEVANGPAPTEALTLDRQGPGHGLAGMRERVVLLGGSLSAGAAPDGGFLVSAVLPVGETA
jgi:signal transduction histidine kinase